MIRNHFKLAFRNLLRHKMYSLINIGGLAMGMSVAIMIGLWGDVGGDYDRVVGVR